MAKCTLPSKTSEKIKKNTKEKPLYQTGDVLTVKTEFFSKGKLVELGTKLKVLQAFSSANCVKVKCLEGELEGEEFLAINYDLTK